MGWQTMRSDWTQLHDALGARRWPSLIRPRWLTWLVNGLPLLSGALVLFGLPALANGAALGGDTAGFVVQFASEMRVLVAIAVVPGSWILLVRLSQHCRWAFPRNLETVADLIPLAMTSDQAIWNPRMIEETVREIVVSQLHVPIERYDAEQRFEMTGVNGDSTGLQERTLASPQPKP